MIFELIRNYYATWFGILIFYFIPGSVSNTYRRSSSKEP